MRAQSLAWRFLSSRLRAAAKSPHTEGISLGAAVCHVQGIYFTKKRSRLCNDRVFSSVSILIIQDLIVGAFRAGYRIRADGCFLGYAGVDEYKRFSDALDIQGTVLYAFGDKYVAGIIYLQYLIAQGEFNIGIKFGEIIGADKVYPLVERVDMRGASQYVGRGDVRESHGQGRFFNFLRTPACHHGFRNRVVDGSPGFQLEYVFFSLKILNDGHVRHGLLPPKIVKFVFLGISI
jgi:hypothetical protein